MVLSTAMKSTVVLNFQHSIHLGQQSFSFIVFCKIRGVICPEIGRFPMNNLDVDMLFLSSEKCSCMDTSCVMLFGLKVRPQYTCIF